MFQIENSKWLVSKMFKQTFQFFLRVFFPTKTLWFNTNSWNDSVDPNLPFSVEKSFIWKMLFISHIKLVWNRNVWNASFPDSWFISLSFLFPPLESGQGTFCSSLCHLSSFPCFAFLNYCSWLHSAFVWLGFQMEDNPFPVWMSPPTPIGL